MIFMTENACPLCCWGVGILLVQKFLSPFMAGKTEFLAWIYFDQKRKFSAMGVMTFETFSFSNWLVDKVLKLHFMAKGAKLLSGRD
jgi:hypothetical protein